MQMRWWRHWIHSLRGLVGGICIIGLCVWVGGCANDHDYTWQVEETHRWTALPGPEGEGPGFRELDSTRTGVSFINLIDQDPVAQNRNLVNGSGVAIGDVNGDEWPDLYLTQLKGENALYLNQGGFRFERVPDAGGAALPSHYSTGVALADLDGDRDDDLIVGTLGGPNVVFRNDGKGHFRPTDTLGVGQGTSTLALADLSGNGVLDLYVSNYKRKQMRDSLPPQEIAWDQVVEQVGSDEYRVVPRFQDQYSIRRVGSKVIRVEEAEADRVYLNDGTGHFEEQDWRDVFRTSDGARPSEVPRHWGLVARLEDLNGDGTPDLYVCNDFTSPDFYYLGVEGKFRFREARAEAIRTTSHSTMSIATTDVERDGDKDFFLADMLGRTYERRQRQVGLRGEIPRELGLPKKRTQEMRNTFQLNRGDGTFVEAAELMGIEASGWTWASTFVDVNLDGYSDLLASTGYAFDIQDADAQTRVEMVKQQMETFEEIRRSLFKYPRLNLKNVAYRNQGDGTFEAIEDGWGLGETADVSLGMATGDLDRDGDLDVVMNRLNQVAGVYRNEAEGRRVAVQLAGAGPNTGGVGATVRVVPEGSEVPAQKKSMIAGGEYLSDSGGTLSFAVGAAEALTIRVRWPSGEETVVEGQAGRLYEIRAPGATPGWTAESGAEGSAANESNADQ